jgi:hypothetical protein
VSQPEEKITSSRRWQVSREIELSISCAQCVRQHTNDCGDCLVSFVIGERPQALELSHEDTSLVQLLQAEGLVPRLRYVEGSRRH